MGKSSRTSTKTPKARRSPFVWVAVIIALLIAAIWFAIPHRQSAGTTAATAPELGEHLHSLVAVGPNLMIGTHGATAISSDAGKTLRRVPALDGVDAMESVASRDGRVAIVAGHDGARLSRDGGATWADISGLPGSDIHGLAVDAADPNHVVAYVMRQGLFGTHDGGTTWSPLGATPNQPMGTGIIRGRDVLIPASPRGLLSSKSDGVTWQFVAQEVAGTALVQSPRDPRMLFLSGSGPLFVSTDGGGSWSQRSLPGGAQLVTIDRSGVLVAVGYSAAHHAMLWRSRDGTKWAETNSGQ